MQSINWIAFGMSNTLTKSVVHFLPTSSSTSAPYPLVYNISLYGKEIGERNITLDDGRLGQPDGVRLEDIFPVLSEAPAGLLALSIVMTTNQPKVDLTASGCVIEIITASNSVRFFAAPDGNRKSENPTGMLVAADAYTSSSLFLVNCTEQAINPNLLVPDQNSSNLQFNHLALPIIEAKSALEYTFEEKFLSNIRPQECSWGMFRANSVSFSEQLPEGVAAYAVYRDTLTKRIVSVKAL